MYPEDLELQSDDRSDKEIRVAVHRQDTPRSGGHQKYGRAVDKFRLGLKPTVRTEVKVGTPGAAPAWPAERGIAVKTDFTLTTGK